jgi:hypothetical protein
LSANAACLMLPMGAFWPGNRRYLGNLGLNQIVSQEVRGESHEAS